MSPRHSFRRSTKSRDSRRGLAVVELAVCLPILLMVTFATLETVTMLYLRQKIKVAAYEGARIGVVPSANASNVQFHCRTLLESQSVSQFEIITNPSDPAHLVPDQYFEVTVNTKFGANSLLGGWIYGDRSLSTTVALRAE